MKNNLKDQLHHIFPKSIRSELERTSWYNSDLEEIRFRVGGPPLFCYGDRKVIHCQHMVSVAEMEEMFAYICEYSPYAYEEQLQQGFITLEGGIRVGMTGQKEAITPMFFNIRVPSEQLGCGQGLVNYLYESYPLKRVYHTLIMSAPGGGKTTLLRDLTRLLSEGLGENISLVDERMELAASCMGVPQNDVGHTTDVYSAYGKSQGCMQAIRTMSPRVIVIDEIGGSEDGKAIGYAMRCGVSILASMHATSYDEYMWLKEKEPAYALLSFQRFVLIHKDDRGKRYYEVLDEKGKCLCARC